MDQNQNSLLVKRQNDNTSPGLDRGNSHKGSKLWQFKRQKSTAPYQPQNCFRNLTHIVCTEKIEPLMVTVLCYLSTRIFRICPSHPGEGLSIWLFTSKLFRFRFSELESNSESVWVKVGDRLANEIQRCQMSLNEGDPASP